MTTPAVRQVVRQQGRQHADAVFERLFPPDAQASVPLFDHLESRAVRLARDLAGWLLEQRIQHAAPTAAAAPNCPRCGQPGRPAPHADATRCKRTLPRPAMPT